MHGLGSSGWRREKKKGKRKKPSHFRAQGKGGKRHAKAIREPREERSPCRAGRGGGKETPVTEMATEPPTYVREGREESSAVYGFRGRGGRKKIRLIKLRQRREGKEEVYKSSGEKGKDLPYTPCLPLGEGRE